MNSEQAKRLGVEGEWERWNEHRRLAQCETARGLLILAMKSDALIDALAARVEERDEALTIAYRLALQDAHLDLREHLEPWSLDLIRGGMTDQEAVDALRDAALAARDREQPTEEGAS